MKHLSEEEEILLRLQNFMVAGHYEEAEKLYIEYIEKRKQSLPFEESSSLLDVAALPLVYLGSHYSQLMHALYAHADLKRADGQDEFAEKLSKLVTLLTMQVEKPSAHGKGKEKKGVKEWSHTQCMEMLGKLVYLLDQNQHQALSMMLSQIKIEDLSLDVLTEKKIESHLRKLKTAINKNFPKAINQCHPNLKKQQWSKQLFDPEKKVRTKDMTYNLPQFPALIAERDVAVDLAKALISETGYFNSGVLSPLLVMMKNIEPTSDFIEHVQVLLTRISLDERFATELQSISVDDLHPDMEDLVRITVGKNAKDPITDADCRVAAISALLSRVRQMTAMNCFMKANMIQLIDFHSYETLKSIHELFSYGGLERRGQLYPGDYVDSSFFVTDKDIVFDKVANQFSIEWSSVYHDDYFNYGQVLELEALIAHPAIGRVFDFYHIDLEVRKKMLLEAFSANSKMTLRDLFTMLSKVKPTIDVDMACFIAETARNSPVVCFMENAIGTMAGPYLHENMFRQALSLGLDSYFQYKDLKKRELNQDNVQQLKELIMHQSQAHHRYLFKNNVKNQQTHSGWALCTQDKNARFGWKTIQTPEDFKQSIIDLIKVVTTDHPELEKESQFMLRHIDHFLRHVVNQWYHPQDGDPEKVNPGDVIYEKFEDIKNARSTPWGNGVGGDGIRLFSLWSDVAAHSPKSKAKVNVHRIEQEYEKGLETMVEFLSLAKEAREHCTNMPNQLRVNVETETHSFPLIANNQKMMEHWEKDDTVTGWVEKYVQRCEKDLEKYHHRIVGKKKYKGFLHEVKNLLKMQFGIDEFELLSLDEKLETVETIEPQAIIKVISAYIDEYCDENDIPYQYMDFDKLCINTFYVDYVKKNVVDAFDTNWMVITDNILGGFVVNPRTNQPIIVQHLSKFDKIKSVELEDYYKVPVISELMKAGIFSHLYLDDEQMQVLDAQIGQKTVTRALMKAQRQLNALSKETELHADLRETLKEMQNKVIALQAKEKSGATLGEINAQFESLCKKQRKFEKNLQERQLHVKSLHDKVAILRFYCNQLHVAEDAPVREILSTLEDKEKTYKSAEELFGLLDICSEQIKGIRRAHQKNAVDVLLEKIIENHNKIKKEFSVVMPANTTVSKDYLELEMLMEQLEAFTHDEFESQNTMSTPGEILDRIQELEASLLSGEVKAMLAKSLDWLETTQKRCKASLMSKDGDLLTTINSIKHHEFKSEMLAKVEQLQNKLIILESMEPSIETSYLWKILSDQITEVREEISFYFEVDKGVDRYLQNLIKKIYSNEDMLHLESVLPSNTKPLVEYMLRHHVSLFEKILENKASDPSERLQSIYLLLNSSILKSPVEGECADKFPTLDHLSYADMMLNIQNTDGQTVLMKIINDDSIPFRAKKDFIFKICHHFQVDLSIQDIHGDTLLHVIAKSKLKSNQKGRLIDVLIEKNEFHNVANLNLDHVYTLLFTKDPGALNFVSKDTVDKLGSGFKEGKIFTLGEEHSEDEYEALMDEGMTSAYVSLNHVLGLMEYEAARYNAEKTGGYRMIGFVWGSQLASGVVKLCQMYKTTINEEKEALTLEEAGVLVREFETKIVQLMKENPKSNFNETLIGLLRDLKENVIYSAETYRQFKPE